MGRGRLDGKQEDEHINDVYNSTRQLAHMLMIAQTIAWLIMGARTLIHQSHS